MPYDRRTGRLSLAMTGLVGAALAIGCLRSTNLRNSAGSLPELAPAGDLQGVPGGPAPGAITPAPAKEAPSGPTADAPPPRPSPGPGPTAEGAVGDPATGAKGPAGAPDPGAPSSSSTAPAGERPAPPPASPTPLLDAEIRRAQAINRQHIESLEAAAAPAPVAHPVAAPPDRPTTDQGAAAAAPKPAEPVAPDDVAPLPPLAASPRAAAEPQAAGPTGGVVVPPFLPVDNPTVVTAPPTPAPPPPTPPARDPKPLTESPVAIADARADDRPADEATRSTAGSGPRDEPGMAVRPGVEIPPESAGPPARAPLEIAALRLCSSVEDFGLFKPVDADSLKTGQRVRVYYEMAGLEYQLQGDLFVSRLDAHLELRSDPDGAVVWEQTPKTALYRCGRPRRDYYASFPVAFPGSLRPGPYRLRLIQTDLIGNRAASREIPITIVR